ncbi:hypothetical protein IJQ19_02345 [bacterium]|nr:hypothetical protein [bacterium]
MSIKYKIDDAKKNKNLINDEIKLSRIKSKGGPGGDGGRKPGSTNKITLSKLSDKVDNLTDNLNKLAKIVTDGFERQEKFNTRIEKEVLNLGSRLDRVIKVNKLRE